MTCLALSQCMAYVAMPNFAPEVLMFKVVFGIVACLLAMFAATYAVRVYIMRKYEIAYKPEWQSVYDFSNKTRFDGLFNYRFSVYTVYCFKYKTYTLYIYAKELGKRCKLLVFDGDALIIKEKYKNIDELFDNAEIDNYKLAKIWGSVKPI